MGYYHCDSRGLILSVPRIHKIERKKDPNKFNKVLIAVKDS